MNPRGTDISVVICAYASERWGLLRRAVESIRGQTLTSRKTIVVIDHNDRLLRRAQKGLSGVTVIENEHPRGLAGSRNTGLSRALGDVVAFLDDDALATPEWLECLTEWYSIDHVVGVGGSIVPIWHGPRPRRFPREFAWVLGCTYEGVPVGSGPVRNLIGANMSFRRPALQAIGGFRPYLGRIGRYPAGCEETDACIRLTMADPNTLLIHEPRAVVFHDVPRERTAFRYFSARCYAEGLSKARLSVDLRSARTLATERAYVRRVLPRGIKRGIGDLLRGDLTGGARAGMIAFGLGMTATGFAAGRVRIAVSDFRAEAPRKSMPGDRAVSS
jgi:glucosyl-dolichyl phosphate glucuronosyltransferase